MEEKKYKVDEFAEIVGCHKKTIYDKIKSGELLTVIEIINGRKTNLVISNDKQIEQLQRSYGNSPVNNSNYKDILTENNSKYEVTESKSIVIIDKVIELSKEHTEQILNLSNELAFEKSKQLLLEDKASREGLYISEINELKSSKKQLMKWLITVIVILSLLLITVISFLIFKLNNPTIIEKTNKIETIKYINAPKRR